MKNNVHGNSATTAHRWWDPDQMWGLSRDNGTSLVQVVFIQLKNRDFWSCKMFNLQSSGGGAPGPGDAAWPEG